MGLLKKALSCGRGTDVRFKTADGVKVGGHSAVLALSCDGFREMFESGMREEEEEEEEGIVVIGGYRAAPSRRFSSGPTSVSFIPVSPLSNSHITLQRGRGWWRWWLCILFRV